MLGCLLAATATLQSASAISQETADPTAAFGQDASNSDQGAGPEGDILNRHRLVQLLYQVTTAPGTDLRGNPVTTTTDTWKLRSDNTRTLNAHWSVVLRGDLPFLAKDKYTDDNPNGNYLYGIGDADAQAVVIDNIDQRWDAGGGARLIAPTGDAALGSGKWRIMPIAAVRYALPEMSSGSYFEPLFRYDVSFAGDPARKSISNLQFAPMINMPLPDRWFFTLYPEPEIRWNFGAPVTGQTGRLFFPFDGRVGKKITDNFNVSLEVAVPIVKQYPVYNFLTGLRLNLTF